MSPKGEKDFILESSLNLMTGSQLHNSRNASEIYDYYQNDVAFKKIEKKNFAPHVQNAVNLSLSKEDAKDKLKYNLLPNPRNFCAAGMGM